MTFSLSLSLFPSSALPLPPRFFDLRPEQKWSYVIAIAFCSALFFSDEGCLLQHIPGINTHFVNSIYAHDNHEIAVRRLLGNEERRRRASLPEFHFHSQQVVFPSQYPTGRGERTNLRASVCKSTHIPLFTLPPPKAFAQSDFARDVIITQTHKKKSSTQVSY